jgi:hypothetical protein
MQWALFVIAAMAGSAVADAQQAGAPQPGAPQPGADQSQTPHTVSPPVDASLSPSAQNEGPPRLTFAISPFLGYRFGGTFTRSDTDAHVGVNGHGSFALAFDLSPDNMVQQYELFYSRQSTSLGSQSPAPSDLRVEYLQFGGTSEPLENPSAWRVRPYLIGSVGATRFTPSQGQTTTDFSFSIGGGLRTDLAPHLALRVEARGYFTVLNASSAVFCSSNQTGAMCLIQARGSMFLQADFLAGVAYVF